MPKNTDAERVSGLLDKGTQLTKEEIFYLLKRAESPNSSPKIKKEIVQVLQDIGLTATYFPTVAEFKLNGVLFAKKITQYSTKRHCFGYKKVVEKYVLL